MENAHRNSLSRLHPNHLTAPRFVFVPAVFALFRRGFIGAALVVPVFASVDWKRRTGGVKRAA